MHLIDTVPTVVGIRYDRYGLEIVCPFCRITKGRGKGKPRHHYHGTGGDPGPNYGHRVAHCVPTDLPPELRERKASLGYYIVDESHINNVPLVPEMEKAGKAKMKVLAKVKA
jgi:hypothetical protein